MAASGNPICYFSAIEHIRLKSVSSPYPKSESDREDQRLLASDLPVLMEVEANVVHWYQGFKGAFPRSGCI